jgi:glutaredoxin
MVLLLLGLASAACGREESSGPSDTAENAKPLPKVPFSLTVDQKGVLYTFVEADGSFHIAEKLSEIPEKARRQVRVVLDGHPPGTAEHVFVADLRGLSLGDEITPVALTREAWEAKGLAYRKSEVAELEKKSLPPEGLPAGVDAVIYGADWCGPCHQAEAYLKKKGLSVVKKDIEKNPEAAREMREKLTRAGLGGSSIPILDVGGTVLVGFSPRAIEAALKRVGK